MRRARIVSYLADSLWLIPMLFAVSGAALALITLSIDKATDYDLVSQTLTGPPATAQAILTTFIAALVTLISIVMTVITVAVQLAMQQFSPRIVRPLLQNRRNQCMIGLFAATLVLSLIVVPQAYSHEGGKGSGLPGLSVLAAEALMLASVVALILYVHQAGQAMRVSGLIDLVGDQTRAMIDHTYRPTGSPPADVAGPDMVAAHEAGVVHRIEYEALVEEARRADVSLTLLPAMGDFVCCGGPLARIHGDDVSRLDREKVRDLVWLGGERSHDDDPAYGIRKLVDIAERGLASPFQDPTTAVMALDRIHDALRMLVTRDFPDGRYTDEDGELRLIVPMVGWDDYVWLAFTELRVAGTKSPQIPRRIRAAIDDLLEIAPVDRRPPLELQLELLDAQIGREYEEDEQIRRASTGDRQGIGSPGLVP